MFHPYSTASSEVDVSIGVRRPAGIRHAVARGDLEFTVCGLPLKSMAMYFSELAWHGGGDTPPRCPACAAATAHVLRAEGGEGTPPS